MFTARKKGRLAVSAVAVGAALALAGCSSGNPLEPADASGDGGASDSGAIVVGSQSYYSNEIIAEIYAQALEDSGLKVKRQFQIGQRDAYISTPPAWPEPFRPWSPAGCPCSKG